MTVDLAYCTAADPLITHAPEDPHDVTRFIAGMRGMCPGLKALKVTAMRRAVWLDAAQMPWQHLALACRELTLRNAATSPGHDEDLGPCRIPMSLHFLFITAPQQMVSAGSRSCCRQHERMCASGRCIRVACICTSHGCVKPSLWPHP